VTQLTCGGIFSNHFIANYPQNASVKEFWNLVNFWRRYRQSQSGTFFGTQCINKIGSKIGKNNIIYQHFLQIYHNWVPVQKVWISVAQVAKCSLDAHPTEHANKRTIP